jgi:hypothetical protein
VSIRRPDGAVLASTLVCGSSGFIDLQVLPVGGTYLITFDPAGTAATSFLYDGSNVTQELTGASVKASMLRGFELDEIFQRTDAAGPRTFLTDALGSALALADDAGVVRTEYRFDPYGATVASGDASGNLVQYTGRENDGTGLYYYRARYYSLLRSPLPPALVFSLALAWPSSHAS